MPRTYVPRRARWRVAALAIGALLTLFGHPASTLQIRPATRTGVPHTTRSRGGRAFATVDTGNQTWTIGNAQIQATFRLTPAGDFILDTVTDADQGRALNLVPGADTVLTINGTTGPLGAKGGGWTLDDVATADTGSGIRLAFTFRSSRVSVVVVRSYLCTDGSPVIEAWTSFRVTGTAPITVSNPNVWDLTLPATALQYLQGLRGDAAGIQRDAAFTLQSVTLDPGDQVTLVEQNRSTEQYLPVVAADMPGDEFFGGLLWSGGWQISALRSGDQTRITAGLPRMDIAVDAGHPLETPHGFFGFTAGSRGDVSQALRAFLVSGLRNGRPFAPMVTYNTWFAYGADVDEQSIMDEMAAAASVGVELFVLDAGWYVGAGHGGDFDAGLGTWQADPARFPSGLGALRAYAHSIGLQFGLWVEPERVDLATVDRPGLVQQAWLATANGSYRSDRNAQVCFGSPAARQWILDQLFRLLDDVQPDYLKWDNNFWVNCNRAGHGHGATDGNFSHVTGLYEVLANLRARYPDMQIENCSQGGNRLDFGMLRYSDTAWMDDRSSPSLHVRHNLEGLMTFLPPAYLLSILVGDSVEPISSAPDLPLYARSRMPGILGLTYRASDLTETDREGLAHEIAVYKTLRAVIRDADGTLLTDQAAIDDGPPWDALQEVAKATGQAIVFAFQNDPGVSRLNVQPKGLDGGATYVVTTPEGTVVGEATGADLMADGIEIDGSPESAAHVLLLRPIGAGTATLRGR